MKNNFVNLDIGRYSLFFLKKEKKQRIIDERILIAPRDEYESFLSLVHGWLGERNELEEKLQLLHFLSSIVKRDIQVDLLSEVYYKEEGKITNLLREAFIPLTYIDSKGERRRLESAGKERVNLDEVVTIAIPWKRPRMRDAIINIAKKGFIFHSNNHMGSYFKEIDLCYITSGNHSIASGIVQKSGYIEVDSYEIEQLFEHISTDGEYWINAHTNERLTFWDGGDFIKVVDFRIAVLYEMAKIKHQYQQEAKNVPNAMKIHY
ncbi:DUF6710 family protein [Virgibacillus sp. Bac330]|uniref:DUF6710 family protein n=1 Tax=Virgibacillus sp. Bac330 TaxID=2419841 RepID=UPI000EF4FA2A|nr:DUF6710 family protein [Virgibacillus sp. Bac330]